MNRGPRRQEGVCVCGSVCVSLCVYVRSEKGEFIEARRRRKLDAATETDTHSQEHPPTHTQQNQNKQPDAQEGERQNYATHLHVALLVNVCVCGCKAPPSMLLKSSMAIYIHFLLALL